MITSWGHWKSYPRSGRGENIEAPIGPGLYEVRHAQSGDLFAFGTADNLAETLARLPVSPRSLIRLLARRPAAALPELEYRIFATTTRAAAKTAAERMIDRREAWWRGAA